MHWLFFAFLNALFHSISTALGKRGAQKVDAYSAAWSQSFFALLVIVPIAYFTQSFQPVTQMFWVAITVASLLHVCATVLFFKAIKDSPLSLVMPILSLTPVFLLISSPLILGEFPSPLGVVGILVMVVGSYILNLSKRTKGIFEPLTSIVKEKGTREMFYVAVLWSIASNFDKIGVTSANPILWTVATFSALTFYMTLILLYKRISFKPIFRHVSVFAPIGLTIGLSNLFQMIAISMTIVPNVIAMKRTSSLFGIIWGKLFFNETNIKERFLGAAVMLIGVILIVLSS